MIEKNFPKDGSEKEEWKHSRYRKGFFFFFFLILMLSLPKMSACLRDRETQTDRNIEKGDGKIESDVGVIN